MKNIILLIILSISILYSGCRDNHEVESVRSVKGVAAVTREINNEICGFGTLSYLSKLDITASQDGLVEKFCFREGDNVLRGDLLIQLVNPHITLSLERAENHYSQAKAALGLSQTKLLEGEFHAEAQLLSIEKAEAELVRIKKKWEEDNRKHQNQEALLLTGQKLPKQVFQCAK